MKKLSSPRSDLAKVNQFCRLGLSLAWSCRNFISLAWLILAWHWLGLTYFFWLNFFDTNTTFKKCVVFCHNKPLKIMNSNKRRRDQGCKRGCPLNAHFLMFSKFQKYPISDVTWLRWKTEARGVNKIRRCHSSYNNKNNES